MWRITKTNPKIFADEKFNDECRDFYISPNENREEAILRFERLKKKCNKKFDFDAPKKFVRIERRDCNISWNECPTCGYPIGYRPTLTDFRCKRCNQRILW